ncbi:hypothetical protein V1525DRAFT_282456 [Lipomyces kononenkoae]|uniref:Uncharacterized protein n=1 Tax=Lipomyces kononenkoae TaxID=34357 RepID=A0ACC3SV13_LIPKO
MNTMELCLGTNEVVRRKVAAPVVLHPMRVLTFANGVRTLTAFLTKFYVEHYDMTIERSSMSIVVVATRASHAGQLLSLLRMQRMTSDLHRFWWKHRTAMD